MIAIIVTLVMAVKSHSMMTGCGKARLDFFFLNG